MGISRIAPNGFTHAHGHWGFDDDTGATGVYTIFTVTGDVLIQIWASCEETLTGASATIELGVAGMTADLIAQTTGTALILNEVWFDASPTTTVEALDIWSNRTFVINGGQDIIQTIATQPLTAGAIHYHCMWQPLSVDGNVRAV